MKTTETIIKGLAEKLFLSTFENASIEFSEHCINDGDYDEEVDEFVHYNINGDGRNLTYAMLFYKDDTDRATLRNNDFTNDLMKIFNISVAEAMVITEELFNKHLFAILKEEVKHQINAIEIE